MTLSFKIVTCSVAAVALAGLSFYRLFSGARTGTSYPDRTVQLSNSAFLRIHSTLPVGAGDFIWEASYRDKSGWEKVDDWVVEGQMSWYGGNILACPVGKLVVMVRTDGSLVFVRTETGHWKTFHMGIPERAPFPLLGTKGTSFTSLETPAIKDLRSRMSMESSLDSIPPSLAQFLPDTRELWVDYLNGEYRRFRLHFRLAVDGEKLEFLEMGDRPFNRATDTSGAPFFLIQRDKPVSSLCNKIEFFR
jgi:hypothetical protein